AVLQRTLELGLRTPVIMLTAYAEIAECVQAMRSGAADFLVKPTHASVLENVILSTLERSRSVGRSHTGHAKTGIVGESAAVRAVLQLVGQVAPTQATVLLLGESGTGKEVIARLIHNMSPRTERPFVAVNCGAI